MINNCTTVPAYFKHICLLLEAVVNNVTNQIFEHLRFESGLVPCYSNPVTATFVPLRERQNWPRTSVLQVTLDEKYLLNGNQNSTRHVSYFRKNDCFLQSVYCGVVSQ